MGFRVLSAQGSGLNPESWVQPCGVCGGGCSENSADKAEFRGCDCA
jgi:hypothetical protein